MKVTTLRFGPDLWELLEREAGSLGISVSQYVREAALARAASAAGARGQPPFALLSASARALADGGEMPRDQRVDIEVALAGLARALTHEQRSDAKALRAEAKQALEYAAQLTEELRREESA
jgi:hypothetical protein